MKTLHFSLCQYSDQIKYLVPYFLVRFVSDRAVVFFKFFLCRYSVVFKILSSVSQSLKVEAGQLVSTRYLPIAYLVLGQNDWVIERSHVLRCKYIIELDV